MCSVTTPRWCAIPRFHHDYSQVIFAFAERVRGGGEFFYLKLGFARPVWWAVTARVNPKTSVTNNHAPGADTRRSRPYYAASTWKIVMI